MSHIELVVQKTFDEVITSASDLTTEYISFASGYVTITSASLTMIYKLLSARYGTSHIISRDYDKFKQKLYSIIFQYGPTWEKNMDIQETLRDLTEADILSGSTQINDHAYNPSTEPEGPNVVDGEITTINDQTKAKWKKSKIEGYGALAALLEKDVTEEFLNRFKKLFFTCLEPEMAYPREVEDDD